MELGSGFDVDTMIRHNYYVKRKDGGEYVAYASVENEEVKSLSNEMDLLCGPMWNVNEEKKIAMWSLGTGFDSRVFGWLDNKERDVLAFQLFLKGELPKNEALLDKYVRLYDRGFIVNRDGKDVVNVIVKKNNSFDEKFIADNVFISRELPGAVAKKIEELVQKKILLEKPYYPGHMYEMLKIWHRMKPFNPNLVFAELLKRGVLQPLTEEQKKGVMVIVYNKDLPESK